MLRHFIAMGFGILMVSSAQAALLTNMSGTVMLNRGEGFWEVNAPTVVKPGDRVLVRGEGGAIIDYGKGCVLQVPSHGSAVVTSKPDCETGMIGTTSSISGSSLKDAPAVAPMEEGLDRQVLIVGGLVAAGGAAAAVAAFDDGDGGGKPASP
jgi:hypothetical protein